MLAPLYCIFCHVFLHWCFLRRGLVICSHDIILRAIGNKRGTGALEQIESVYLLLLIRFFLSHVRVAVGNLEELKDVALNHRTVVHGACEAMRMLLMIEVAQREEKLSGTIVLPLLLSLFSNLTHPKLKCH